MKKINLFLGAVIAMFLLQCTACDPNPNGHADYILYGPNRDFPLDREYENHPDSLKWHTFGWDLEYDIYLDTVNPPKLIVSHWKKDVYYNITIEPNKDYYWQVAARDTVENQYAISKVSHFSTSYWAHTPFPADSSVVDTPYFTFSWLFNMEYIYYWGFQFFLKELGNSQDTNGIDSLRIFTMNRNLDIGPLKNNTTYRWYISCGDSLFSWSTYKSKTWTFTTQF